MPSILVASPRLYSDARWGVANMRPVKALRDCRMEYETVLPLPVSLLKIADRGAFSSISASVAAAYV